VCDRRPVCSSNFCLGVNFLKIMFWFYVQPIRCWVATSGLVGFWCVFLLDVFWETTAMTLRVLRGWSFPPPLYIRFIHYVYGYLASEYLVLYLYNKSTVIEHQFTVCRLFDCLLCVCLALGSCFHKCWREPKCWNSAARCRNSN
jgi:hypothetical protein